jgi:hypothetical protein
MNHNFSQNFSQNYSQNFNPNHNLNYDNMYFSSVNTNNLNTRSIAEINNFNSIGNINNSYPYTSQFIQGSQDSNFSQVIKNNFEQSFQKLPEKISYSLMNKLKNNFSFNEKRLLSAKKSAENSVLTLEKNLEDIKNKIEIMKNKLQTLEKKINEITSDYEHFEQNFDKWSEIEKSANLKFLEINDKYDDHMVSFIVQIETILILLEKNNSPENNELKNNLKILNDSIFDFKSNLDLKILEINNEIKTNNQNEKNSKIFQLITNQISEVKKKLQCVSDKIIKKKYNKYLKEISKENFNFLNNRNFCPNTETESLVSGNIINKDIQLKKKKKLDICFY